MTKKVTINVRARNKGELGLKEVEKAEEVKIESYPDERFFVHKSIDIKGWTLTEFKTGLAVVYGIKTKRDCIQEATDMLNAQEQAKFLAQIEYIINRFGYANEEAQDDKTK